MLEPLMTQSIGNSMISNAIWKKPERVRRTSAILRYLENPRVRVFSTNYAITY